MPAVMASTSRRQQEATASDAETRVACGVLEALARNVVAARTARRWSQTELANAAGLTQQRISMIEVAASDMTLRTVAQIATALKTTPSALLRG